VGAFGAHLALAADGNREFSLQVTPSPLFTTVKPGQDTTVELKIRNGSSSVERLKIEPRSFRINNSTGEVQLGNAAPVEIANWIQFDSQQFTIGPGEWHTENITFSLPEQAGFSYSFALVISRQKEPKPVVKGRLLHGSVAVFTLVNVDRPGATRQLSVAKFTATKRVYEFLPATFEVDFRSIGNSIVQPYGNVYIQRSNSAEDSAKPLAVLPVNEQEGYILPGTSRTTKVDWKDGFPIYETTASNDSALKTHLRWNWSNASNFRFGRYTAKLVAVYNDGTRDVPIQGEISFWVIPWRLIILGLVVVAILGFGIWSMVRKTLTAARNVKAKAHSNKNDK